MSHAKRERVKSAHPVLVTMKLVPDAPSMRRNEVRRVLVDVFLALQGVGGFRVVEFSIQSNHLHLIAEGDSHAEFTLGMKSLVARISKRLNAHWGRRGKLLADRFHARHLKTPRHVRNALRYVLNSFRHHCATHLTEFYDRFSSAPYTDAWDATILGRPPAPWPVSSARTWLLTEGWRRHYPPIGIFEQPA